MAGNSQRRGAVRKPGSKKGMQVGSGGQRRRGLEGKGPTPKAEERDYHPAAKKKAAAEKRKAAGGRPAAEAGPRAGSGARSPGAPISEAKVRRIRAAAGIEAGSDLIAGRNPVTEAVRAGVPLRRVLLSGGKTTDERLSEVVRTATALGAPLIEISRTDLDVLTENAVHQGVAIEVPPYDYRDVEDLLEAAERSGRPPLIIALDQVTDPHNLGAVLRSGGAFGAHGVVVPERRSAGVGATAWKVSAGAAARVPVARVTNLVRSLEALKEAGCFVVGLDGGGEVEVRELQVATEPLVLVTGAEGKGLSRLVRESCDVIASIPITSDVESLNAAVATGIALYEVDRLRAQG